MRPSTAERDAGHQGEALDIDEPVNLRRRRRLDDAAR